MNDAAPSRASARSTVWSRFANPTLAPAGGAAFRGEEIATRLFTTISVVGALWVIVQLGVSTLLDAPITDGDGVWRHQLLMQGGGFLVAAILAGVIGHRHATRALAGAAERETAARRSLHALESELAAIRAERDDALDQARRTDARIVTLERHALDAAARALESDSRAKLLLATTGDGIITCDGDGVITQANAAAGALFGHTRRELTWLPLSRLLESPNTRQPLRDVPGFLRTAAIFDRDQGREMFAVRRDGQRVPIFVAVGAASLGRQAEYTLVVRDLTAVKRTEAELLAAKELAENARRHAENANQAKSRFIASMSHELRTPLNAMLGFAQLMAQGVSGPLNEKQNQYVDVVLAAGQHLHQLIGDILDLAKIEAGQVTLSLEAIPAHRLVEDVISLNEDAAERHGTRLINAVAEDGPTPRADHVRLKQVLVNLIGNGVKYGRPGGTVTVTAEPEPSDPRMCRLVVADDGSGIPAERLADIFQPFNRAGAETGNVEGSGIGLTITKRLVELMDGRIAVESVVGKGSRFIVELPLASPDDMPRPIRAGTSTPDTFGIIDGHHTVLCIEDNPFNAAFLRELLTSFANVTLFTSNNVKDGFGIARRERPDLVLMDINLTGIDGFGGLQMLRADPATRNIPVIAVSATAMPEEIRKGMAAGFASYLVKPLQIATTLEAINLALDPE